MLASMSKQEVVVAMSQQSDQRRVPRLPRDSVGSMVVGEDKLEGDNRHMAMSILFRVPVL